MRSRPAKFWRFIPFWPFGLAAVLGILWWQRIAIVAWLIGLTPLVGDWQIVNLKLRDINLSQVEVEKFELAYGTPGHDEVETLKLTTEHMVVDYQLFTENWFSVESVLIGQAMVAISRPVPGPGSDIALGPMLREAREILQQPIPEIKLAIDQLRIENSQQLILADPLGVALESNGKTARVTVSYNDQLAVFRTGSASGLPAPDDMGDSTSTQPASTREQPHPQRISSLSLIATESGIDLDAEIDLEKLHQLATEIGVLTTINPNDLVLSGPVQLNAKLTRPDDQVMVDFVVHPLDIEAGQIAVSAIHGSGRVAIPASQTSGLPFTIRTIDNMEIKATSVTYNENRADNINLNLTGILTVSQDNFDLQLGDQSRLRAAAVVIRSGETRPGETRSAETGLSDGSTQISDLDLTPVLSATLKGSTLLPGFSIQAGTLVRDDLAITDLGLTPRQPVTLGSEFKPLLNQPFGTWHVDFSVTYAGSFSASSRLNVNVLNLDPDNLNLQLVTEQLQFPAAQRFPAVDSAELVLTSKDSVLSGQGRIALGPLQDVLDITMDHDPGQNQTTATVASTGKVPVQSLLAILNDHSENLLPAMAIERGSTDFMAEIQWTGSGNNTSTGFKLELTGYDIGGRLDDVAFQGLNLDLDAALASTSNLQGTVHATFDSIDYGLAIRGVDSAFSFASTATGPLPVLNYQHLSGVLFESRFYSGPFSLDLNNPDTQLVMKVDNLDIQKLVEAQGIDDLFATGRVSGIFPVTVDHKGITITNGTVNNLPGGGRIQYNISDQQAKALDNPLTDIVITALRDFRYEVLTADANYHPDGELFLDFHLEGVSPQLDSDRQVNLNINTRQNVLSLLRSLNYSDGLNQTIDHQIQDNMK